MEMDTTHPLKALLQLQLASDSAAVLHLSYVLSSLTPTCFSPSSHTQNWTTRINSLLHSKDPGARWAGLCIAYQTSIFSKSIMIESAQSWLGVALPILSKNEPSPTLKASIRLLAYIFSAATDVPEFQRQLATPNVPKFSLALISLAEKQDDLEVKLLSLAVLTQLIPLYPTLHRAHHAALQAISLNFLNGSAPKPTDWNLLEIASRLYSVLHFTGGKVGAVNLWRKSLDETLAFARAAFLSIRTSFPNEGRNHVPNPSARPTEDPIVWVPLNIDRLRCGVTVICDLMRTITHRPVQMPIGSLVKFTMELLSSTTDGQIDGHVDPAVRAMEVSAIPSIWKHGCALLICLAKCARHHLTPSQARLISCVTYHLEQPITAKSRLLFLKAIQAVLTHTHSPHSPILPSRLAKAILPSLTVVLATQSEAQRVDDANTGKNKKGKKRARGYEGDEVFKVSREVVCLMKNDGEVLLAALDAIRLVLRNPHLAPPIHSLTSRVLLSMLLTLPQMSSALLSPDLTLHGRVLGKVREICVELGSGTTSTMSKSLGIVIRASIAVDGSEHALSCSEGVQHGLDLLLHPRVPPLVRSIPHVESLSLFRAEEGLEEIDAREALRLGSADQLLPVAQTSDNVPTPAVPETTTVSHASPIIPSPKPTAPIAPPPVVAQSISAPPSPKAAQLILSSPPNSLPSSSASVAPMLVASGSAAPVTIPPVPASVEIPMDDDEDEEMPTIDMDSDSD